MQNISFEDFKKVDIRIGKIISAERLEDSNKLLKLQVDFGDDSSTNSGQAQRQILAGIAKFYEPENLVGKFCPFVFNLAPKKMGEYESQGMILAADDTGGPVLLHPDKDVKPGSIIK